MKLKFKSISVICLIILLLTAACGKKPEPSATTSAKTSPPAKTTAKTATKTSTTKASTTEEKPGETNNIPNVTSPIATPGQDEDGPVGGNDDTNDDVHFEDGPFAGFKFNPYEIDCGGRTYLRWLPNPAPTDERTLRMIAKTEELFNVKIEHIQVTWWNEVEKVKATWLAGVPWADGPFRFGWVMPWGLAQNLFVPVDDYIDFNHERFSDVAEPTKWIDGKHYSFADSFELSGSWIGTTFYNTEILEREGLEDILSLYKKGQWDWERFRDYLIISTNDRDGDGVIEQWGSCEYGTATQQAFPTLLRYSKGVGNSVIRDGQILFSGFEKNFINAMQFYQTLKHIDKVLGKNQQEWMNGRAMIILAASNQVRNYVVRDIPFRQAPLPVGPDAEPGTIVTYEISNRLVPAIANFTPQEIIAIETYLEYNDPDDPLVYIDPYEAFMERASDPSQSVFFHTEEERLFFYDYYTNTSVVGNDSFLGRDFANLLGPYMTRIGNGESVGTVIESSRLEVESFIKDIMYK